MRVARPSVARTSPSRARRYQCRPLRSVGWGHLRDSDFGAVTLLKLYALPSLYRQGEFDRAALYETDILMLHQGAAVDDEALLGELRPYMAPGDVAELRSILAEQRGRRRFGA